MINFIPNEMKEWAVELSEKLKEEFNSFDPKEQFTLFIGGDGTFLFHKEKAKGISILIGSETSKRAHIKYYPSMKYDNLVILLKKMFLSPSWVKLPLLYVNNIEKYALNDVVIHTANH